MMFYCVFVTFPCGVLGQVWYLIVSIPDLCLLTYFYCYRSGGRRWFGWCLFSFAFMYTSSLYQMLQCDVAEVPAWEQLTISENF